MASVHPNKHYTSSQIVYIHQNSVQPPKTLTDDIRHPASRLRPSPPVKIEAQVADSLVDAESTSIYVDSVPANRLDSTDAAMGLLYQ
jgi:hypothetical protein